MNLETKRIKLYRDAVEMTQQEIRDCDDVGGKRLLHKCLRHWENKLDDALDRAPYLQERPVMPEQVATNLLCIATDTTNSKRKLWRRAREKHYVATQGRVPGVYKQAARFNKADLQQVIKWLRRAQLLLKKTKRDTSRKSFLKQEAPWQNLQRARIEARIEALQSTIDQLKTELQSRTTK